MPKTAKLQLCVLFVLTVLPFTSLPAQTPDSVKGTVVDEQGGVLVNVQVVLTDQAGESRTVVTDERGTFQISGLPAGTYTLEVQTSGFEAYQNFIQLPAGAAGVDLRIVLPVAVQKQEVTVESEQQALSLSSENNAGAIILREEDLAMLPDDPDELAEALQALAGPSAGPNGGSFYIDGFSGGRMPPKSAIREVRINQNPFSAEYDRIGFGRVEIFTKPGAESFNASAFFNFNDEALNSRNPYAPNRAPYQARHFGGRIGGPLKPGKASFSLDLERREFDENAVINARVLDSQFIEQPFSLATVTPQRGTSLESRVDVQLSPKNTLVGRYSYSRFDRQKEGIGEFSLLSRAFDAEQRGHDASLSLTTIASSQLINEFRFRFDGNRMQRIGDNTLPGIRVLDAFTGGGSQVGLSSDTEDEFEFRNNTSYVFGNHSLKFGAELERVSLEDISRSNFGGNFTFAGGGLAPQLDAAGNPVLGSNGSPVLVQISSLERYRRTLFLQSLGVSGPQLRLLGGGATQFSIAGGNPGAHISQTEFAGFFQNDWRVRQNLLLSAGIRYETQNNIGDHLDFAPRVAFAWSPFAGGNNRPSTVIRGGVGMFYDRFGHNLVLEARRFNGTNQLQYIVINPDFFPNVPTVEQLQVAAQPQTLRQIGDNIQTPYSVQTAISLERQLPLGFTTSLSYVHNRTLHVLRSRVNQAALRGANGARVGRVYEYVSDGVYKQNQLMIGINNRFSRRFTVFSHYSYGKARSNTDGASSFPVDGVNLTDEWGPAGFDVRHRVFVGGSLQLPVDFRISPFIMASSGRPFDITTGRDLNGDSLFTERPAFALNPNEPGVVATPYGLLDPTPDPGQPLIPRNLGEGPGFFAVNFRLSRVFGFGSVEQPAEEFSGGPPPGAWAGRGRGGGSRGGRGGRGGYHGGGDGPFGGSSGNHRYNLTFSVQVQNVFNRVNDGPVIGNLSSPLFGLSNSTGGGFGRGGGRSNAGNRRIELQLRFNF